MARMLVTDNLQGAPTRALDVILLLIADPTSGLEW